METIVIVRLLDGYNGRNYLFSQLSEAEKQIGRWIWKQVRDKYNWLDTDKFQRLFEREDYREMIVVWNGMPFLGAPFVSVSELHIDTGEIR